MKRIFKLLYFVTYLASLHVVKAVSHQGKWKDVKFEKDHLFFVKSMYKNTDITVDVSCEKDEETGPFVIEWMLRYSPCAQEYQVLENGAEASFMLKYYLDDTKKQYLPFNYSEVEFMRGSTTNKCKSHGNQKMYLVNDVLPSLKQEKINGVQQKSSGSEGQKDTAIDTADEDKQDESAIDTADKEKKDESDVTEKKTDNAKRNKRLATTNSTIENITVSTALAPQHDAKIGTAWRSGYYVLILRVNASKNLKVNVEMKGRTGYISAVEWPLLIFYGVMGLVYIIYGLVWIVLLACNWRELMRLQFWIGGVIVLGMLEKAVFYSEYQSIANTGLSVAEGTLIIAEVISCFKRALARMLIIIVSVGFGVVRPRLGPTFHKVLFVGGLYFILAVVEGCMRTLKPKGDQSTDTALAALPLALLDAAICWWIFSAIIQTTRQLRLRRNLVKLSLYRHFANTLVFTVIAALIFMVWALVQVRMKACQNFNELWVDDAFWHLLFSLILGIIMILWRPSSNNQRYAFSPLIDASDDEDEDETNFSSDAFDVKARKKQANGSPKQKQNTIEDDLKWVEENIPSTLSDKAKTLIDDSDEEVDKYEVSKMQ